MKEQNPCPFRNISKRSGNAKMQSQGWFLMFLFHVMDYCNTMRCCKNQRIEGIGKNEATNSVAVPP